VNKQYPAFTRPIKTAVVGYGFSAKTFHAPFLNALQNFTLSAISSRQVETVKRDCPEVTHFLSAKEMLCESEAELVIITAPNDVHFSLAKLALENNKHVVLEKPFVTKTEEGEVLIALAKEKNLILSVYQNRRWDGDFLTVDKLIKENRLGKIKVFESHFDRFRPKVQSRWRETAAVGGGILFDLGPHLIDQALQLFGLPEAITATCRAMRENSENTDFFHLTLHYPDKVALLQANLFCSGPNIRFRVQGDEGSYEKMGLDPQESRLKTGLVPNQASWADETEEEYGFIYEADKSQLVKTERGGYQVYYQELAEAIRNGGPAPVTAEQSLQCIKLILLAIESNDKGKTLKVSDKAHLERRTIA